MRARRAYALAAIIFVMIVWGSTFVVTKAAVEEIPPLSLSTLRFLIAAIVLAPFALARGGLAALPRPIPVVPLLALALTGVAFFHVAFNYALVYGSAAQGAVIYALAPAAVAAAAVVALGETLSRRRVIGIVLSIAGVVVVVSTGEADAMASPRPLLGSAWMLAAVAAWGVYTVIAKRLADADQIVVIACVSLIGMVIQLPLVAWELAHEPWPTPTLRGWGGALFLGVVASAAAFVLYNRVLRELEASLVAAFLNLDPIVGVLTAVVLLGEEFGALQMLGAAVALAGMWLASSDAHARTDRET